MYQSGESDVDSFEGDPEISLAVSIQILDRNTNNAYLDQNCENVLNLLKMRQFYTVKTFQLL